MKSNKIYANEFSDLDCDWIIEEAEKVLDIKNAVVGEDGDNESSHRKSQTGFINYQNPSHNKLWDVVANKLWTVQLSNGDDYEGGDFQLRDGTGEGLDNSIYNRGSILVFPSFLLHRVTPVTSGTRKTLVAWFEGKRFK